MSSNRVKRHRHRWRRPFRPTLCADEMSVCGRKKWTVPLTASYAIASPGITTRTFYTGGGQKEVRRFP